MLGRIRQSSCPYRPTSTIVTSESGCPVVIENWLAPQFFNPAGVGTVGNAAINSDKQEPDGTLGSYADKVENVNAPLKFAFDTLESVIARSRPPNLIRCLP